MRRGFLIAVFLLVAQTVTGAGPAKPARTRIRCLSGLSRALAVSGVDRSALVETFVGELERSDVVVYLEVLTAPSTGDIRGSMRFVSAAAGLRYLLIQVNGYHAMQAEQIAVLGHELWHALEVARAPGIRDLPSFRRYYQEHGVGWGSRCFETDEARAAEQRVRADVADGRPRLNEQHRLDPRPEEPEGGRG